MELLFFLMAAIVVASAMAVVAFKNPIHSALALVLNLLTVAGLFAQLGAHFLAVVQVIVYAGAIMVLVTFVLMLLNFKVEQPQGWPLVLTSVAVVIGALFAWLLIPVFNEQFRVFPTPDLAVEGTAKAIGTLLFSQYLFPFEAASVLILAAIVGAVMLAKKQYRKTVS